MAKGLGRFFAAMRCDSCRRRAHDGPCKSVKELKGKLARYGDHASNCAYRLAHYKGPVPACDCGWNEYVASLTHASGGVEHGD
jgi:hypothetical protein